MSERDTASDWETEALARHFLAPARAGLIDGATTDVRAVDSVCGDSLRLTCRIEGRGREARIAAARFQVFGCPAAIACASLLAECLDGRSRREIRELVLPSDFDALRPERRHAADLARSALALTLAAFDRLDRP